MYSSEFDRHFEEGESGLEAHDLGGESLHRIDRLIRVLAPELKTGSLRCRCVPIPASAKTC